MDHLSDKTDIELDSVILGRIRDFTQCSIKKPSGILSFFGYSGFSSEKSYAEPLILKSNNPLCIMI